MSTPVNELKDLQTDYRSMSEDAFLECVKGLFANLQERNKQSWKARDEENERLRKRVEDLERQVRNLQDSLRR